MAYTSDIDLGGLGEVPKTADPQVFGDFSDVYNAIHILAQWVAALKESAEDSGSGGEDQPTWEAMPYKHWVWLPAARAITEGMAVSMLYSEALYVSPGQVETIHGVVPGVGGSLNVLGGGYLKEPTVIPTGGDNSPGAAYPRMAFVGIALTDAAEGELVQVGVGQALLRVPGLVAGTPVVSAVATRVVMSWGGAPTNSRAIQLNPDANGSLVSLDEVYGGSIFNDYNLVGYAIAQDTLLVNPPQMAIPPLHVRLPPTPSPENPGGD